MEERNKKTLFYYFDEVIRHLENTCVGLTFGSIVILVSATVFYRYVLKKGIMWSGEIQEVLVVAMAMFGCAKATREKGHTELNSLTGLLPRKGRVIMRTITTLAALIFIGVFFYESIIYASSTGHLKTIMLRIPYRYFYIWLPIGMGLNLYEFLKLVPGRIKNDPPKDY